MNEALWTLIRSSGLARLARSVLTRRGAFVLELHGIAGRSYPELPERLRPLITVEDLREILRWLANHFDFLTPDQLLETDARGVLLSFDDGFSNNAMNALPILEEAGAPAVFFVTTQHVVDPGDWLPSVRESLQGSPEEPSPAIAQDLYRGMSAEELRRSAAHPLITIGAHSLSHPRLTECDDTRLEAEVAGSRRILQGLTGKQVDLFAYPYGDYDDRVLDLVRSSGFRAAFAEDTKNLGHPVFEIPRVGLYSSKASYLSLKLSGLHRRPWADRPVCQEAPSQGPASQRPADEEPSSKEASQDQPPDPES